MIFSKDRSLTIEPYKFIPYSMLNIHVKGYVNDTILIKLKNKDAQPILKLKGEINEIWKTDYYGEGPRTLIIEAYKASDGELEIQFNF